MTFDDTNTERRYVLIAEQDSILGADQVLTPEEADICNQKMAARGEKSRWQPFSEEVA